MDERRSQLLKVLRNKIISGESTEIPYREDEAGLARQIFHKKYMDRPMLIVSIAYLILAFFETPRWHSPVPYPDVLNFHAISAIEGIFVTLLCLEVLIEISFHTDGKMSSIKSWLKTDPWTLQRS